MGLVHETMGPTLLMGPKGRYTLIELIGGPNFYRALIFSYIKPVFIGLSSYITHHNTATCDVRK